MTCSIGKINKIWLVQSQSRQNSNHPTYIGLYPRNPSNRGFVESWFPVFMWSFWEELTIWPSDLDETSENDLALTGQTWKMMLEPRFLQVWLFNAHSLKSRQIWCFLMQSTWLDLIWIRSLHRYDAYTRHLTSTKCVALSSQQSQNGQCHFQ